MTSSQTDSLDLIGNSFDISEDTTFALVLEYAATMMTHLACLPCLLSISLDNIGHYYLCHMLSAIILSSRSDQICGLQRPCTGNPFTERKHLHLQQNWILEVTRLGAVYPQPKASLLWDWLTSKYYSGLCSIPSQWWKMRNRKRPVIKLEHSLPVHIQ